MDHSGGAHKPMGQAIKEKIPGTPEYEATHATAGMGHGHTGGTQSMGTQIKSNVPGTREYEATHPGHSGIGHTGGGMGAAIKSNVPGTREYEATHPGHLTGSGTAGHHHTGGGILGLGTGPHEGAGFGATGPTALGSSHDATHKSAGQKIKEAIPGTREHEAKKLSEGRM